VFSSRYVVAEFGEDRVLEVRVFNEVMKHVKCFRPIYHRSAI